MKKMGESCCHSAMSRGAGRQLSLLPCSVHLNAGTGPLWSRVPGGRHINLSCDFHFAHLCCGLGMVFPSLVLSVRLSKPCATHSPFCLPFSLGGGMEARIGGRKSKDQGLQ